MPKEKATEEEVLGVAVGARGSELSGPQRAALKLAVAVFTLIAVCSVGMLLFTMIEIPPVPGQPKPASAASVELHAKQLVNHNMIRTAAIDGAVKLFQTFVVAALLPVLMTTIGYIFGRGEG